MACYERESFIYCYSNGYLETQRGVDHPELHRKPQNPEQTVFGMVFTEKNWTSKIKKIFINTHV